jgi:hypothetical protein
MKIQMFGRSVFVLSSSIHSICIYKDKEKLPKSILLLVQFCTDILLHSHFFRLLSMVWVHAQNLVVMFFVLWLEVRSYIFLMITITTKPFIHK